MDSFVDNCDNALDIGGEVHVHITRDLLREVQRYATGALRAGATTTPSKLRSSIILTIIIILFHHPTNS